MEKNILCFAVKTAPVECVTSEQSVPYMFGKEEVIPCRKLGIFPLPEEE